GGAETRRGTGDPARDLPGGGRARRHRQGARPVQERKRASLARHVPDGDGGFSVPAGSTLRQEKAGRSRKAQGFFQPRIEGQKRCSENKEDKRTERESPKGNKKVIIRDSVA